LKQVPGARHAIRSSHHALVSRPHDTVGFVKRSRALGLNSHPMADVFDINRPPVRGQLLLRRVQVGEGVVRHNSHVAWAAVATA
jgi:hypothetical protein